MGCWSWGAGEGGVKDRQGWRTGRNEPERQAEGVWRRLLNADIVEGCLIQ